ncbi:MAG TPA: prolyl oligopeptidase family serine peptidase [Polyangiaceae bacterium]|jgi:pimeloyl-ACP methyl ester carboxylesterase
MARGRLAGAAAGAVVFLAARAGLAVTFEAHANVRGVDITTAEVRSDKGAWQAASWDALDETPRAPGTYEVRLRVKGAKDGATVAVPHCAGRQRLVLDGAVVPSSPGPAIVGVGPGDHELVVVVKVSAYEKRIACGERPRLGALVTTRENLGVLGFSSPYAARGGGQALVYVPPGHDLARPSALLVGLHPWNGTMWTYAAYSQLLREARARDVLLLMPSGLGNSLYTADPEDEVLRAIDALAEVAAVDPRRVSLWGASMGGAGATTIGFHNPDRFAGVTSFFGDSKYDLTTYVRSILPDEAAAHRVNALDVVDNALHLPVWLIHGVDDRTSPIRQSELLAQAMADPRFSVRFTRAPGMGHEGPLVARHIAEVVDRAATARVPEAVTRVEYRSVRAWDTGAYGVHLVRRSQQGDAAVAVDARKDGVHVTRAEGVRAIVLDPGALGTSAEHPPAIALEGVRGVEVRWAGKTP